MATNPAGDPRKYTLVSRDVTEFDLQAMRASVYPQCDFWGLGDDRNGPGVIARCEAWVTGGKVGPSPLCDVVVV